MNKGPRSGRDQKPKDRKMVLKRLWGYLYRYKWRLLLALMLTVVSNLLALLGPMLSGRAIDAIGGQAGAVDFERVLYNCALMILFYLISSVLTYVLSILMINLSQQVTFHMRKDLFEHLLDLPVSFFDTHQAGDIVSRLSYDIDTVNTSLSSDLLQVVTSAITVFGSLGMMLAISPMLVLVFVVTIPISVVLTAYMTKRVRPLFSRRSQKLGELNGYVEEIITGHRAIDAYHQQATMLGRFDVKNTEAVDAYYKADYYGSMVGPSVNFVNNLSLALIS
ncbi:ABC transporter ATP-binding protein, partial [Eubacteriales bacterium OttesenSCG-928-A19]|nr:ABC transporter ATP-binding protein [Eubacteriales bacterium OttesenSCG-928-A19]